MGFFIVYRGNAKHTMKPQQLHALPECVTKTNKATYRNTCINVMQDFQSLPKFNDVMQKI